MLKCTKCGLCKTVCPIFRTVLKESSSPRGRAIYIEEKIVSGDLYNCSLCGACEEVCPIELKIKIREGRENIVKLGKETEANKKMIENIRKHGNPFGKIEEGKEPDELHCC